MNANIQKSQVDPLLPRNIFFLVLAIMSQT